MEPLLSGKQQRVLAGMGGALATTLVVLGGAVLLAPPALTPPPGFAAALQQALQWDVLVVSCLAVNIALLARHRFFAPADIDGGGLTPGSDKARVLQAILQNTLEQAVLALGTHLIWAAVAPLSWQPAVPAAACLFVIGRILFMLGYAKGAPARAFGFALTFYPSVALLVVAALQLGSPR